MIKKGKKLVIVGVIFIFIALFVAIYNNYRDIKVKNNSQKIVDQISKVIEQNKSLDESNKKLEANINGYDTMGTINIPELDLVLPILTEWSYDRLRVSPCIYYGSIETNDLVICGHSYKSQFRYLYKLDIGDLIIITDLNNNEYIYEVCDSNIVNPSNISEMINDEYDLTLFTCINGGTARFALHCNKVL